MAHSSIDAVMSLSRQICELNRQFRDVAMLAEQGYLYLEGVHGLVHPKVRRHILWGRGGSEDCLWSPATVRSRSSCVVFPRWSLV